MCWVSHSSPLEHAWAHAQAQTINILQLDQRSPKAPGVKADHIWTHSRSWRLLPKGPSAPPVALLHLESWSFRPDRPVSLQETNVCEGRWASASGWSLGLVWHVCRNSWPLSSALTATLVTTGIERLSCCSFVSSGSGITSHLSQDYSSDLLFPLIRTNAAERSNSLFMFLICSYFRECLDFCVLFICKNMD